MLDLRWTKEPPTVAGLYMIRRVIEATGRMSDLPTVVRVNNETTYERPMPVPDLRSVHGASLALISCRMDLARGSLEWAGPIPEPGEGGDDADA